MFKSTCSLSSEGCKYFSTVQSLVCYCELSRQWTQLLIDTFLTSLLVHLDLSRQLNLNQPNRGIENQRQEQKASNCTKTTFYRKIKHGTNLGVSSRVCPYAQHCCVFGSEGKWALRFADVITPPSANKHLPKHLSLTFETIAHILSCRVCTASTEFSALSEIQWFSF